MLGSNTAGASQSWVLDWSYNNIAYKYGVGDWELYTDTSSPSSFGFGIKTGINFNNHNVKIATIGAQIIGIDNLVLNVSTSLPTFVELFDISNNTGGSGSQGASGILNISDGSGGWLAMDGSSLPLLQYNSISGNLVYSGGNDLFSDNIKASLTLSITDNSGELRFRDSNDTINLARFHIARDSLGTGLHELYLYDCKRLTIPNDLKVAGDITFDNTSDSGTNTGKKMLVIDTTSKEVEERPIPSGVTVGGLAGEILTSNGSGGITALGAPTKFGYDSSIGYVDSPTTPLGATGFIASNGFFYFNCATNNLSEFQFRSNSGVSFGKLIGNSTLGTLLINGFNEFSIGDPLKILSSTTLSPIQVPDQGTNTNKVMLVMDFTSGNLERRPIPSGGGSPSQGSQYDFNYSDGSGGWTALSSPRFYFDNSTSEIVYQHHIQATYFNATLGIDLKKDNGQFRFKNNAGTTTHALINTAVDSLGPGLHELLISLCEQVNINSKVLIGQDLRVSGDLTFPSLTDSGTNTNKEMMVWDNTTAEVEIRPIPTEKSVVSFTNPSTLTPDASTTKQINANAQAQALTINVPTNPSDGDKVIYRIRAISTSTLSWSTSFSDLKGNLPTSAPINKTIVVGVMYNDFISTWEVVSVVEQT